MKVIRSKTPKAKLPRPLAVAEAPEWTYDPMDADRPLVDPRTV
jgi:hypothetical protein